MLGDQSLDRDLGLVGQRIVGGAQVGELGLATFPGHDMGVEHRERARHGAERGVGVPQSVGQPVEPPLAVGLEHVGIAVEIGNIGDLVGRDPMLDAGVPRLLGRRLDGAEVSGKGDLLVVGELLVVKDHDRVAVNHRLDGVTVGSGQGSGEIDVGNLSHEVGVDRRNGNAHDHLQRLW
jgi:hypothetical protein